MAKIGEQSDKKLPFGILLSFLQGGTLRKITFCFCSFKRSKMERDKIPTNGTTNISAREKQPDLE